MASRVIDGARCMYRSVVLMLGWPVSNGIAPQTPREAAPR